MNSTKKILIANKFYYNRGGDCIYSIHLEKFLKKAGYDVAFFSMNYPKNFESKWSEYWVSEFSAKNFMRPFGDRETKIKFTKLLDDFKPDIVHLNNIHTQISPIIAKIAHSRNIKVIWTLHDYKLICPSYLCLNGKGEICEKCFGGKKNYCTANRCIKNNWLYSFVAQKESEKWNREFLEKYTDVFICPSNFLKQKMIQSGFSENKLRVLHNFVDIPEFCKSKSDSYYLYVGRLSREKGVSTLCSVASKLPYKLKIIGSGSLEKGLREKYKDYEQIEFLGSKSHNEVLEIMANAKFTVCPSEYYENNPLVIMESLSLDVPALGANIGGIPELIEQGVNGELFDSVSELKNKIEYMMNNEYRFDKSQITWNLGTEKHLENLVKIYERKKIVFGIPCFVYGGAEFMLKELILNLDKELFDIYVITKFSDNGTEIEKILKENNIKVIYSNCKKGFSLKFLFKCYLELKRIKPDIIHSHLGIITYFLPYIYLNKCKCFHTIHNIPQKDGKRIYNFFYKKKVILIGISDTIAQMIKKFYNIKYSIPVIYNPVNLSKFKEIIPAKCDNTLTLIIVARLCLQKNHKLLLEAFSQAIKENVQLKIVGDGPLKNELIEYASNLGISEKVKFLGQRDDIPYLLKSSDIFVLSSLWEGLPLSVLEAMAAGLPIISTDVGGVKDIVKDNGILVEKGNAKKLYEAIIKLVKNNALREEMGKKSLEYAKLYDSSVMAKKHMELYICP
jgi:glycosyltransferase involved in cell wall biosynthesis